MSMRQWLLAKAEWGAGDGVMPPRPEDVREEFEGMFAGCRDVGDDEDIEPEVFTAENGGVVYD